MKEQLVTLHSRSTKRNDELGDKIKVTFRDEIKIFFTEKEANDFIDDCLRSAEIYTWDELKKNDLMPDTVIVEKNEKKYLYVRKMNKVYET